MALLEAQAADRVEDLVPIRYGRMLASPFAFYRGAAAVMAADLAETSSSGITVQACGDAHLANFGGFAAPDRRLIFDINDFDETLPGPWEWDVKRLVASLEVATRDREFGRKQRVLTVQSAAMEYREQMRRLAAMGSLEAWYERVDLELLRDQFAGEVDEESIAMFDKNLAKAKRKTSERAFAKLAREVDGEVRIVSDPPLITPLKELLDASSYDAAVDEIRRMYAEYRATLPQNLRKLLDRYRLVDVARKVVGVGSVGTRAWIVLLIGRNHGDPLFLQIKEAQRSVLEPHAAKSIYGLQGRRVVEGQRIMQAAGDILLGWMSVVDPDREAPRLLRPPTLGREGLGADRPDVAACVRRLRAALRRRARQRPRPLRATGSRSPPTSAAAIISTGRWSSSPTATRTRTRADYAAPARGGRLGPDQGRARRSPEAWRSAGGGRQPGPLNM